MAPPGRDLTLPRALGPYRLEARLGAGGMGEVYRAYDERLRRRVAIKHIVARVADKADFRQRFRREARTVARLNHPAIVQIYDILEIEDGDWIVMELVEGRTLRELEARGEITLPRILRLAREIAGALAVAHAQGIVHRDLKAENVMVTKSGHASAGRAKILDFGLAKRLEKKDPSDTTVSRDGIVVGTFRAMAPEQITEGEVDARSDLFSFGTLLYEMCTGKSPFRAANVVATMTQVCHHQQPPAQSLRPDLPAELSDFIDRLLEKDPELRPQSALEVVRFLDRLTGGGSVSPPLGEVAEASSASSARLENARAGVTPTKPMPPVAVEAMLGRGWPAWLDDVAARRGSGIAIKTLSTTGVAGREETIHRLGQRSATKAFVRLEEIRRELLARHGGHEREEEGDLFMVLDRPAAAVELALAYHRAAARLAREVGAPLAVRTGIHLGEMALDHGPLDEMTRFADDAEKLAAETAAGAPPRVEQLTARVTRGVMSLARPGQILLTQAVDELVKRGEIAGLFAGHEVEWREHGLHRLPEVGEDVEVFEVGLAGEAPLAPPEAADDTAEGSLARRFRVLVLGAVVIAALVVVFFLLRDCTP